MKEVCRARERDQSFVVRHDSRPKPQPPRDYGDLQARLNKDPPPVSGCQSTKTRCKRRAIHGSADFVGSNFQNPSKREKATSARANTHTQTTHSQRNSRFSSCADCRSIVHFCNFQRFSCKWYTLRKCRSPTGDQRSVPGFSLSFRSHSRCLRLGHDTSRCLMSRFCSLWMKFRYSWMEGYWVRGWILGFWIRLLGK
jgi:hypothetical protein